MHLLLNSASQQAALTKSKHALAHAHLHNPRRKHTEREMNMEIKKKQACKYLVLGNRYGLPGAAGSTLNHCR